MVFLQKPDLLPWQPFFQWVNFIYFFGAGTKMIENHLRIIYAEFHRLVQSVTIFRLRPPTIS